MPFWPQTGLYRSGQLAAHGDGVVTVVEVEVVDTVVVEVVVVEPQAPSV